MILFDERFINKLKSNGKWEESFAKKYIDDSRFIDHKTQLEGWFSNVQKKRKNEIRSNFLAPYYNQHWSAFWEMAIADYLIKEGFEIAWGKEGQPDLFIKKDDTEIAVEIRGLYPSDAQNEADDRMREFVELIEEINSPVALSVSTIINPIPIDTNLQEIAVEFKEWLVKQEGSSKREVWDYRKGDCRIRIELLPELPINNGKTVLMSLQPIEANRQRYIRETIFDKKQKYADELESKGILYIIALGNSSGFSISDYTVETSLFGNPTVTFDKNNPSNTETGRDGKGYIVPKQELGGPENQWLGGVLYFTNEFTEGGFNIKCTYLDNHWATHTIPSELLNMRTFKSVRENDQKVTYNWVNGDNK